MWPTLLAHIIREFASVTQRGDGAAKQCKYCCANWQTYGCARHVLFECPPIAKCACESVLKHGPGTKTGIDCSETEWHAHVKGMARNPCARKTGMHLQVRLVYFDTLLRKYRQMDPDVYVILYAPQRNPRVLLLERCVE